MELEQGSLPQGTIQATEINGIAESTRALAQFPFVSGGLAVGITPRGNKLLHSY